MLFSSKFFPKLDFQCQLVSAVVRHIKRTFAPLVVRPMIDCIVLHCKHNTQGFWYQSVGFLWSIEVS